MNDRSATNILLAVIAGVLLFGQSAMTGALQTGAIVVAVGLVALLLWAGLLSLITWIVAEWTSAANNSERAATVAIVILMPILACVFLTGLWAMLQGEEHPIDFAMQSAAGKTWMYTLAVGLVAAFAVVTWNFGQRMIRERSQIPARLKGGLVFYLVALVAVVAFPIREWRSRRAAGLNMFWAGGNALIVMLVGLMISLATIGFSMLVGGLLVGAIPLATIMQ